jgi:hypothetical protein
LKEVGYWPHGGRVFRFKPEVGSSVVFFVNYKPEPPAAGFYIRSLFNTPQLNLDYFLRPPFSGRDIREIDYTFRQGMFQRLSPIPMTNDAMNSMDMRSAEINKAIWQEFCRE